MRRLFVSAVMMSAFAGLPALTGCDRTVSETKTEKVKSDGTQVKTEDKTVQKPDGTVVHTEEQSKVKP